MRVRPGLIRARVVGGLLRPFVRRRKVEIRAINTWNSRCSNVLWRVKEGGWGSRRSPVAIGDGKPVTVTENQSLINQPSSRPCGDDSNANLRCRLLDLCPLTLLLVQLGCHPRWRPSAPGTWAGLRDPSAPGGRTSARPDCTDPPPWRDWGPWVPLASWSPSGTRACNMRFSSPTRWCQTRLLERRDREICEGGARQIKTIRGFMHVTRGCCPLWFDSRTWIIT